MDTMKKLLMMDSRAFNRLTSAKDNVLSSIEGEMSSILDAESLPDDVKAKHFSSAQTRYMKIEHPQWGETTTANPVNPADGVLNVQDKPVSQKLKNRKRLSLKDKHQQQLDREVIRDSDETDTGVVSKSRESSMVSRSPSVYITPGRPNTRGRRKKIKFETLYK